MFKYFCVWLAQVHTSDGQLVGYVSRSMCQYFGLQKSFIKYAHVINDIHHLKIQVHFDSDLYKKQTKQKVQVYLFHRIRLFSKCTFVGRDNRRQRPIKSKAKISLLPLLFDAIKEGKGHYLVELYLQGFWLCVWRKHETAALLPGRYSAALLYLVLFLETCHPFQT